VPNTVEQHLLQCAAEYSRRAAHPVVAWDCMGAATWAGRCRELAAAVSEMSDTAALTYLQECRAGASGQASKLGFSRPLSFIVGFDLVREMDKIVDPIAREKRGWIAVSTSGGLDDGKLSTRPSYRRMLETNHCVGFCGRKERESDDAWSARRVAWLGKYHPDVLVICRDSGYGWGLDGGQCTSVLGSVQEFASKRHLDMEPGTCRTCYRPTAEHQTSPGVRSYSTECGPMCGECHKDRAPHRHTATPADIDIVEEQPA
jgi:hypothetical protein